MSELYGTMRAEHLELLKQKQQFSQAKQQLSNAKQAFDKLKRVFKFNTH